VRAEMPLSRYRPCPMSVLAISLAAAAGDAAEIPVHIFVEVRPTLDEGDRSPVSAQCS
jgi:hypothetical protein